jgi:hypothetical protein
MQDRGALALWKDRSEGPELILLKWVRGLETADRDGVEPELAVLSDSKTATTLKPTAYDAYQAVHANRAHYTLRAGSMTRADGLVRVVVHTGKSL